MPAARQQPKPAHQLSADEARLLAVQAQGLTGAVKKGHGVPELLRHVGAVQLDTISVLARSHELVAYARLGAVGRQAVEQAYWGEPARAFEYYAHAGCILPIEMWPHFAFRREQLGQHIVPDHAASKKMLNEVQARLRDGPVTATDLGGARKSAAGWWNWSDAKRALEVLYRRGEAICVTRRNWKRVYDLPKRVLPQELLHKEYSAEESYRHLTRAAGKALGVGTARDIAGYYHLLTPYMARTLDRKRLLADALAESGLVPVEVEGWKEAAFADPAAMKARAPRGYRTTLLSPFDSLVWADPPPPGEAPRERTRRLFGYDMTLEVYLPKAKRVHGYFTMPLLAEGRLVGHVDPAREGRTLVARRVSLDDASAVDAMASALREAATWVGCDDVRVEQAEPRGVAKALRKAVR
ncbi:MAG: crosslink repair DNA glycosylase YcaQ family protein [Dehalococcoidia bacterium]